MIKKVFIKSLLLGAMVLMVSCQSDNDQPLEYYEDEAYVELCPFCGEYAHKPIRQPTPPMNIHEIFSPWQGLDSPFPKEGHDARVTDFVAGFENVHTVTYTQLEMDWYGTIILWADEPLHDFAFVSLDISSHDWGEDGELTIDTREVLLNVPRLLPSDAVVLNVSFAHYLLPHGAIIFTGEDGVQRRMFIWESMRGECYATYHLGEPHEIISQ